MGMETTKPLGISMSSSYELDKDENGKSIDHKLYRDIIESYSTLLLIDQI